MNGKSPCVITRRRQNYRRAHWKRQNGKCAYCGKPLGYGETTLDHKLALSWGGPDNYENTVVACYPCNAAKADHGPAWRPA